MLPFTKDSIPMHLCCLQKIANMQFDFDIKAFRNVVTGLS